MTVIFDQFSLLDPQRAQRQLETQQGKQIFDQFGTLDPARAERQVEAALGKSVFDPFSMYDSDRALRQIEAAASGGGGYVAKAVDCTNWGGVQQIGTSVADSHICSGAIWVNYSSDYLNWGGFTFDTGKNGANWGQEAGFEFYNYEIGPGSIAINTVENDGTQVLTASSANGVITNDVWYPFLWSLDSQNGIINLRVGDIDLFDHYGFPNPPSFPFAIPFNGNDFLLGNDPRQNGPSSGIRLSNCWISTTQFVDWSNQVNRRKVFDAGGHPVDPGDGSLFTGSKPEMFFTGDATTFGTNAGICGPFTTNGTFVTVTGPT